MSARARKPAATCSQRKKSRPSPASSICRNRGSNLCGACEIWAPRRNLDTFQAGAQAHYVHAVVIFRRADAGLFHLASSSALEFADEKKRNKRRPQRIPSRPQFSIILYETRDYNDPNQFAPCDNRLFAQFVSFPSFIESGVARPVPMSFFVVVVIDKDVDDDEGIAVFLTDHVAASIRVLKSVDGVTQRFVDVNRICSSRAFSAKSREGAAPRYRRCHKSTSNRRHKHRRAVAPENA